MVKEDGLFAFSRGLRALINWVLLFPCHAYFYIRPEEQRSFSFFWRLWFTFLSFSPTLITLLVLRRRQRLRERLKAVMTGPEENPLWDGQRRKQAKKPKEGPLDRRH